MTSQRSCVQAFGSIDRHVPAKVLAWSEALLDAGFFPRPAIALWSPMGITAAIGLAQNPDKELFRENIERDGVSILRRPSGGGAVLLYDGVLCWEAWATIDAIAANEGDGGIRKSYAFLIRPVMAALQQLGVPVIQAGICDLSCLETGCGEPRKLAGTAQLRRKQCVLVHGSLLVDADIERLAGYLRLPEEQPEYRRGRRHRDFCMSVAECLAGDAEQGGGLRGVVAQSIVRSAGELGWEVLTPPGQLDGAAVTLEKEKYSALPWNLSRLRGK